MDRLEDYGHFQWGRAELSQKCLSLRIGPPSPLPPLHFSKIVIDTFPVPHHWQQPNQGFDKLRVGHWHGRPENGAENVFYSGSAHWNEGTERKIETFLELDNSPQKTGTRASRSQIGGNLPNQPQREPDFLIVSSSFLTTHCTELGDF
eukprot:1160525-Pelagomonas_calceolata.AAC.6